MSLEPTTGVSDDSLVSRYLILVSVLLLAFGAASCGSSGHRTSATAITLGSKHAYGGPGYGGNIARGWGTAHPRLIFNGGDPSGKAWNIRWQHWGAPVATGRGLTWVARPKGSYYAKPGTIEMRGFLIKKCGRRGSRGYSRVRVRVASTGGHFSRWYLWGGRHNLCVPEYAPGA
jgi:hypothetical protein